MNIFYRIPIDSLELEVILKQLYAEYRANRGNFMPFFSDDKAEVLVQIKHGMDPALKITLDKMGAIEEDQVSVLDDKLWSQPEDVKMVRDVLEGRKPIMDLIPVKDKLPVEDPINRVK